MLVVARGIIAWVRFDTRETVIRSAVGNYEVINITQQRSPELPPVCGSVVQDGVTTTIAAAGTSNPNGDDAIVVRLGGGGVVVVL